MTGRNVLFTAQKNEGPFILEWVAFHKAIGFDEIIVFSNDCDDGSDRLLDALADAGELTHRTHTPGPDRKPQMNAERLAREEGLFQAGDWVMWLDLDEFLFVQHAPHTVDALIKAIAPAQAVALAWRHFGDAGVETWPGRQFGSPFILAEKRHRRIPRQCKTLFRWGPEIASLQLHRPIFNDGVGPDTYPVVSGKGAVLGRDFYSTDPNAAVNRTGDNKRTYRHGQVFHYAARTPDLFHEKKVLRGRGYREAGLGPNDRHSLDSRPNFNQTEERCAEHLVPRVTDEMRRLFALPGIAPLCTRIAWFRFDD